MNFKYQRHLKALKRLNIKRLINLFILVFEAKIRKKQLTSRPIVLRVNTFPFCNLKCHACKVIKDNNPNETTEIMSIFQYKEIIDKMADHLLLVILYDEGEPLLNKEITEIISYTSSLNISTSISTNLSFTLSDEFIQKIVNSGLDRMTVAIDGSTQEIYERYRVGGNLELVINNLNRIIAVKETKSKPFIEVQFLNMGFNSHQENEVKKLAYGAGANMFRVIQTSISGIEQYYQKMNLRLSDERRITNGCFDLWYACHISSNGMMFPCDFGEDNGIDPVGSLYNNDFESLWNSDYIKTLRGDFNKRNCELHKTECKRCTATNRILWPLN